MPARITQACLRGAHLCGSWLVTGALWTLWLCLALLFAAQAYLASSRELELPGFAVREIEARLAASGMHATFGRTVFDPSGRALIEDLRVTLASFEEPVLTARAVYFRVDPWTLIAGRFEPLGFSVTGLSLRLPAMLSSSGRTEEVVRDLDAAFLPEGENIEVEYLNCKLGKMSVAARGAVRLGASKPGRAAPLPLMEHLGRNFAAFSREFSDAIQGLGALDQPILDAVLKPSRSGGAVARLHLVAQGFSMASAGGIQAGALEATTRLPISGPSRSPVEIVASAKDIRLARMGTVSGVWARFRGQVETNPLRLDGQVIEITAAGAEVKGLSIGAPFATLEPGPLPKLRVEACGWLAGQPMSVGADVDLKSRSADLRFDGRLAPALLDYAASQTGRDLRKFVDATAPVEVSGGALIDPGWKFGRVSAVVATRGLKVRSVTLDEARGRLDFDGRRLTAPEAFVRSGEDFARGSYEQDVATREYRFLLEGRLRPLNIAPWFPRWWPAIFDGLAFPKEPPSASLDLRGRWTEGRRTSAFVQVDSPGPVIRGAAFDRIRTRLFARPTFTDGIEILATDGSGEARGAFARRISPGPGGATQSIDFEATSSLDLRNVAKAFGPKGEAAAAHLAFERPPVLGLKGRIVSSKSPGTPHLAAHFDVRSEGLIRLFNWPFEKVSLAADLRDGDLTLDPIAATVAGGTATGRLAIGGSGPDRRVSFSADCKGANLGQAIVAIQGYLAQRKGARPLASSAFLKEKANVRFDLEVSADGKYGDPFSYKGAGKVSLQGSELGELRVLGLLSELFRFTSLRFTSARGSFNVAGRQLVFPAVSVTGANSAIDAHGSYALDRHELDFKAKIYPLKESRMLPGELVNAVLTPFSTVFEVKLTGSVANPSWKLANGPTNLLHNLAQPPAAGPKAPVAGAPPAK